MRTYSSFHSLRSLFRTFAPAHAVLLLAAFATPALSEPAKSGVDLIRQLERMEQEVSAWSKLTEQPKEAQRLLRNVQFLRYQARENLTPELDRRFNALEILIQTGVRWGLEIPGPNAAKADKQGTLGGTVTDASSGTPLGNVEVSLWNSEGGSQQYLYTNSTGSYTFEQVEAGQYLVTAEASDGLHVNELHDDIPCTGDIFRGCDPTTGTPITVVDQGTVQIDFVLDVGGSISGTVTSVATGLPLEGIPLWVWDSSHFIDADYSDPMGRYRISGLGAGNYYLTTEVFDLFLAELFDDLPCPGGGITGCQVTSGTPVSVALETETTGINFALDELGKISGRITDTLSGDPIPYVTVNAWDAEEFYLSGFSDDDGRYEIGGLPDGSYFVSTRNYSGFVDELFDDLPCPSGNCDPTTGHPISVQLDHVAPNIDFVLEGGCLESETVMCLTGDRFRVEATWTVLGGNSGKGKAVELTEDSGFFWFFADTNIEVVVKVLNACTLPGANNFWVFAGGLTNVEVTLTVTDTQTGQVREYRNNLGTAFQPIQDTAAFSTCP